MHIYKFRESSSFCQQSWLIFLCVFLKTGKWICYNCQNHPISPVRLVDSSGFVSQDVVMKSDGASNIQMGDDLQLHCDEDLTGECTVEVKDIHIQGVRK